ncbi:hypothetical protein NQ318_020247 [Aromia moschata]|uniref:Mitochondrial import inner membrane translocase subunit Tim21 n=1 Tax=Aromia moschata TaxID=1265417 RepID=A0AAV8ZCT0_9CUCU|nr:hypothetical protein NQ318_020247 [Aromia moschata]
MLPVRIIQPFLGNCRPILKYSPILYQELFKRQKSSKESRLATSTRTELDTNVKPLGEKVKETTKTVSYLGIILLGVGVTGTLFYAVFSELFSSKSPNNIYSKAVKKCIADHRVEDKLGYPISAYGEETRRGRRRHVSHAVYTGKDGRQHLRMKFYLKGSFHSGDQRRGKLRIPLPFRRSRRHAQKTPSLWKTTGTKQRRLPVSILLRQTSSSDGIKNNIRLQLFYL